MEKIKSKFEYGFCVGVNRRSNEFLVADENGIWRIKWAPWRRSEGDEEVDGEVPEGVKDEERKEGDETKQDLGENKNRVVYVDTRSE
eukprot:11337077-Karenia_brevis.AAC.1